jgi:TRAP-type C4-dicarboxylate transport system permease small subunit
VDSMPNLPKRAVGRILVSVEKSMRILACAIILAMMLFGFMDVILRYFFNAPIVGAKEIQTCLLPIIVSLALAATQFDKSHIRMDILYDKLSKRTRTVIDYLSLILSLAIWVLITWQSVVAGNHYVESGRVVNTIHLPMAYLQYIAAFGAALLCLEMLRQILRIRLGRDGKVNAA